MWGRRPKWEESRLAASGGVASSGHPVDGSVRVAEDEGDLCSSFHSAGFVSKYAGLVSGHVRNGEVGRKTKSIFY